MKSFVYDSLAEFFSFPIYFSFPIVFFFLLNGVAIIYFFALLSFRFYSIRLRRRNGPKRRRILKELGIDERAEGRRRTLVGFFHPYCNAGGGGERVLWAAIAYFQRTQPEIISVVYTGDQNVTKEDIIKKAQNRFDITLSPNTIHLVFLTSRRFVEDDYWRRFTLLMQSLGSIWMAWEAMSGNRGLIPDIYIDTMGYAFTFPLVKGLAVIPVGGYVHYPTISMEMVRRVRERTTGVMNKSGIANSWLLTRAKLIYYHLFLLSYSFSLRSSTHLMANSSWTASHIDVLLHPPTRNPPDLILTPASPTPSESPSPSITAVSSGTSPFPNEHDFNLKLKPPGGIRQRRKLKSPPPTEILPEPTSSFSSGVGSSSAPTSSANGGGRPQPFRLPSWPRGSGNGYGSLPGTPKSTSGLLPPLSASSSKHGQTSNGSASEDEDEETENEGYGKKGKEGEKKRKSQVVYPPCDTNALARLSLEGKETVILSVAQFRPEKEHEVQIQALKILFDAHPELRYADEEFQSVRLILAGSVRNRADEERVEALKKLAEGLGVLDNVEFAINVSYPELIKLFSKCMIGINTMVDEHFGINVVEFMAAGLAPIVHASGGPLADIVVPHDGKPTGFHASSPYEFATRIAQVLSLTDQALLEMRSRARRRAIEKFSVSEFEKGWLIGWEELKSQRRECEIRRWEIELPFAPILYREEIRQMQMR